MPAESPGLPVWTPGVWGVIWEVGVWASGTPPPVVPTPSGLIAQGMVTVLAEDVVYSLPAKVINITVITSAGTIEVSLDNVTWQAMTLDSNKNFTTSAVFIRSTGGDSSVIAKTFES